MAMHPNNVAPIATTTPVEGDNPHAGMHDDNAASESMSSITVCDLAFTPEEWELLSADDANRDPDIVRDELEALRIENENLRAEIAKFLTGSSKQPQKQGSDTKEISAAKETPKEEKSAQAKEDGPVIKETPNAKESAQNQENKIRLSWTMYLHTKRVRDIFRDHDEETSIRTAVKVLKAAMWVFDREVDQLQSRTWVLKEEIKQEKEEKKVFEDAFYHLTKRLRHVYDEQEKRRATSQALQKAKKTLEDRVKYLESKEKADSNTVPPFELRSNNVGGQTRTQRSQSSLAVIRVTATTPAVTDATQPASSSSSSPSPSAPSPNHRTAAPGQAQSMFPPSARTFLATDAAKSRQRSEELEGANAALLKVNKMLQDKVAKLEGVVFDARHVDAENKARLREDVRAREAMREKMAVFDRRVAEIRAAVRRGDGHKILRDAAVRLDSFIVGREVSGCPLFAKPGGDKNKTEEGGKGKQKDGKKKEETVPAMTTAAEKDGGAGSSGRPGLTRTSLGELGALKQSSPPGEMVSLVQEWMAKKKL